MITTIETTPMMALGPRDVDELVDELQAYHAIYSPLFQRREQRYWAGKYLRDLLLEMPRKSIEPMMLTLHGADPNAIRAMQQFVGEGAWDDQVILKRHWREVDETLGDKDGVLTLDGSDFLKQGKEIEIDRKITILKSMNILDMNPANVGKAIKTRSSLIHLGCVIPLLLLNKTLDNIGDRLLLILIGRPHHRLRVTDASKARRPAIRLGVEGYARNAILPGVVPKIQGGDLKTTTATYRPVSTVQPGYD